MPNSRPAPALHLGENLAQGLRRVILDSLADAGRALQGRVSPTAIHTARIRLKQARAALRLYSRTDKQFVRTSRRRLAALARRLAPQRDATVVAATARELAGKLDGPARDLALRLGRSSSPRLPPGEAQACGRRLATELERLRRQRFPFLPHDQITQMLLHNLRRARHRAHKKLSEPRHFHSWRKAVLLLRDQILTLAPALPTKAPRFAARLKRITHKLGQAHDLQLLIEALPARAGGRAALLRVAQKRQEKRVAQAHRHWTKARRHGKRAIAAS